MVRIAVDRQAEQIILPVDEITLVIFRETGIQLIAVIKSKAGYFPP